MIQVPPSVRDALRRITAALLVALLAVGTVAGPSRVLCIGTDGHVGVEMPQTGCCGVAGGPVAGASQERDADDDCDGCVDVVVPDLGVPVRAARATPDPDGAAAPVAVAASALPPAIATFRAGSLPREPDVPRRALAHLRTVVLRC